MKFLPANNMKNNGNRFDITSSIMNALTFGLLITAISGFAQEQSPTLIAAEVIALLVIGFFLCASPTQPAFPTTAGRFTAYPYFCLVDRNISLLVCRPNAGHGFTALFPTNRLGS